MLANDLTAREAALIAAARREAAARAGRPAEGAREPVADAYERVAALMEAERRENRLQRARLRRYGAALTLLFILPFLAWSMLALLPHLAR
jgi:hypothetical protein